MNADVGRIEAWHPLERAAAAAPHFGELLRMECVLADAVSRTSCALSNLWLDLVSGRVRVTDCFFTDERCFVALQVAHDAPRGDRRLAAHKVRVLERILLGEAQKAVTLTLDVAPSTVTLMARDCLRAMGLDCPTSRVPVALVMAAHAFRQRTKYREARLSDVGIQGSIYRVLSAARPDAQLCKLLSPAECEVARMLVEGRPHAEMAILRRTSTRTVANQLAAAFHKLDVSGRAELLCRLVGDEPVKRPLPFRGPRQFSRGPHAYRIRRGAQAQSA